MPGRACGGWHHQALSHKGPNLQLSVPSTCIGFWPILVRQVCSTPYGVAQPGFFANIFPGSSELDALHSGSMQRRPLQPIALQCLNRHASCQQSCRVQFCRAPMIPV